MPVATDDFDYGSATVPEGAIFVAADEPLLIYPSARAAERDLEAIDVDNGLYPAAFGPNGEPYRIGTAGRHVTIEPTGEAARPEELRTLLVRYLEAIGNPAAETDSLAELAARAWRAESDFWQEHDPYGDRFGGRIPLWGCAAFVAGIAAIAYLLLR